MRRRDVFPLLGSAALAWPEAVRAQQTGRRLPLIGMVAGPQSLTEISGTDPVFPWRPFVHRLRDLGWTDDQTIVIERRSAEGRRERAASIMAELVDRHVAAIVVGASDWLRDAAQKATQAIPIIALFTEDPVAEGLVASLARPGGNLIGVTTAPGLSLIEKRLELLKELAPNIARIAFIGRRSAWEAYRGEASAGVAPPVFAEVERAEQFDEAFATVLRERADALLVSHGPVMFTGAPRIAAFAAEKRLPAIFPWREAAEAGGLISYGPVVAGHFRQMADLVDRILKGAKPAEMPIEQPTAFELVVNLKTAKALSLAVSTSLLTRADQVIE